MPTGILAISLPYMTSFLEDMAEKLAELENHRTNDNFDMSLTAKRFSLSFIANYLPILLTAFVYIPLGRVIIPHLEHGIRQFLGSSAAQYFTPGSLNSVDGDRLRDEVIALTTVGLLADMFDESIKPFLVDAIQMWYRDWKSARAPQESLAAITPDDPDEHLFLESIRHQSTLEPYNVQDDISEMAIQFGYLALFAPIWPLLALGFLINNWIELRSDFLKLCVQQQRPPPIRTEGIGQTWLSALDGLAWMGSITAAAFVHMYGGDEVADFTYTSSSWLGLLAIVFLSEHTFLVVRSLVRVVLQHVVNAQHLRHEKEMRYAFRKKYLDSLDLESRVARDVQSDPNEEIEMIKRRESRLADPDAFWKKQAEIGACEKAIVSLVTSVAGQGSSSSNKED